MFHVFYHVLYVASVKFKNTILSHLRTEYEIRIDSENKAWSAHQISELNDIFIGTHMVRFYEIMCFDSCDREEKSEKLSYWKGDTSYPLRKLTVGQLIDESALKFADRTAISLHNGEQLTYKQVNEKVILITILTRREEKIKVRFENKYSRRNFAHRLIPWRLHS